MARRVWYREPPKRDLRAALGAFLVIVAMLAILWYFGEPTYP